MLFFGRQLGVGIEWENSVILFPGNRSFECDCSSLDIHVLHLIHTDLKPENLLVSSDYVNISDNNVSDGHTVVIFGVLDVQLSSFSLVQPELI
ncbi:hypothetical protein SUGI_0891220 [Cryptomeria japonica]|nr:hypothetical protein SUGI_0891220 [Cryptomeria japonica]